MGQLGSGIVTDATSPVAVTTTAWETKKIVMLAAGETHSMAVDETGVLYTWGDNTYGQIGDGTTSTIGRTTPKAMSGVVAFTVPAGGTGSGYTTAPSVTISGGGGSGATATATVTAGKVTAVTVVNSGSGYTSTPNVTFGGGGGTGASVTAVVNPVGQVVTVAAGAKHSLALDVNGTVWAWGNNASGQLGMDPTVSASSKYPVSMSQSLFWRKSDRCGCGIESFGGSDRERRRVHLGST